MQHIGGILKPIITELNSEHEYFSDYVNTFVQRIPRYAVKSKSGWRTKNKPLSDLAVQGHLDQKYTVGTLARWYPEYAILDYDGVPLKRVEEIRAELGLDDRNSILSSSESPDSYHLLFRPEYNGKPPTTRLLNDALKPFAQSHGIEVYPQAKRVIRLPFGKDSINIDETYRTLDTWNKKLYWFQKLDPFDLENIEHQLSLQFPAFSSPVPTGCLQEARYLYENGLQLPSSRHEGQFLILLMFFRHNFQQCDAEAAVWHWINSKHNGFSKDIRIHPAQVRAEIERQACHIWGNYELASVYPDSTHNVYLGYITKPDIAKILRFSHGNIPKSKFLFNIVKYVYPRRHRLFINVHSDKLRTWAGVRTSLKYLNEFENKGIVKRGTAYAKDRFSKNLQVNWPFGSEDDAIFYDGRAVDSLESTLRLVYEPQELRELLITSGAHRTTAIEYIRGIYKGVRKGTTYNNS